MKSFIKLEMTHNKTIEELIQSHDQGLMAEVKQVIEGSHKTLTLMLALAIKRDHNLKHLFLDALVMAEKEMDATLFDEIHAKNETELNEKIKNLKN